MTLRIREIREIVGPLPQIKLTMKHQHVTATVRYAGTLHVGTGGTAEMAVRRLLIELRKVEK